MKPRRRRRFDLQPLLAAAGIPRRTVKVPRGEVIFRQGDVADSIMYVQEGHVKKSVFFKTGREAVVAAFGPGDFFGEACLTGQLIRMETAIAFTPTTVLVIDKATMVRLLHTRSALADRFLAHLLIRNVRLEDDLVDQLANSAEQRLARTLLLLAGAGRRRTSMNILPTISQATLAGMVGTTRSRINHILQKFKRLGFIDMAGRRITVRDALRRTAVRN
jgi:CRP/FNR family cyclic AMP-dependent transcriptional regulator